VSPTLSALSNIQPLCLSCGHKHETVMIRLEKKPKQSYWHAYLWWQHIWYHVTLTFSHFTSGSMHVEWLLPSLVLIIQALYLLESRQGHTHTHTHTHTKLKMPMITISMAQLLLARLMISHQYYHCRMSIVWLSTKLIAFTHMYGSCTGISYYLHRLIHHYEPPRPLCSGDQNLLALPTSSSKFGTHAFSYSGL